MSVEVELSITDYHNILCWYELAFAKKNIKDIADKDHVTYRKVTVMAQSKVEEQKELEDDDKETA